MEELKSQKAQCASEHSIKKTKLIEQMEKDMSNLNSIAAELLNYKTPYDEDIHIVSTK